MAGHLDAASPLLYKQRQLLQVLNDKQRLRHRDLKNDGVKQRVFQPGDLVIVRKQVQSNSRKGISTKLVFRAKGPYRVLRQEKQASYILQKLPFLQGLEQPGKERKESAFRIEKIPSTLILHKKADGADTRFAQSRTPVSEAPLETWLSVLECGAYKQADNDPAWAFVKLDDMWSQEIEHDDNSDDNNDYDDEYNSSDSDDGNDDAAAYPAEQDYDDDGAQSKDEDARDRGVLSPRQPVRRNLTSVERRTLSRFHKKNSRKLPRQKLCFIEY